MYRIVGRNTPNGSRRVAGGRGRGVGGDVAYVPATGASSTRRPPARVGEQVPVEVREVDTGSLVVRASSPTAAPSDRPRRHGARVLGRRPADSSSTWYAISTRQQLRHAEAPARRLARAIRQRPRIVFRVGRSIRAVDIATKQYARRDSGGDPLGLSVAGDRVAWAENVHGHGRIRAVTLTS